MSNKRAHKTLCLQDKLKILSELNKGKSGKHLASIYGVGTSTISDIKKNAANIKRFTENSNVGLLKNRKTLKTGEYKEFEEKLYEWFEQQRARHQTISSEILRQKGKALFEKMYGTDKEFKASEGWLQKFKKRYCVRSRKICGESLSSRPDLVPDFQKKIYDMVEAEELVDCQIYNADESALFWKMFPDKTLVHAKEKSAPGRKMSKERVTFLVCANRSGTHKLNIAVIGKAKNPRSFKNNAPIEYYSSKNAWMTSFIFSEWFFKSYIPQVKSFQTENNLPHKAILIADNARCHAGSLVSECGHYKIIFMPPNCTSIIQPMDQNAIRLTKLYYKKDILYELVNSEFTDSDAFLKQFSLKEACEILVRSWDKVSNDIIKSCWKNIQSQRWTSEDNLPLSVAFTNNADATNVDRSDDLVLMLEMFNNNVNENGSLSMNDVHEWVNESNENLYCTLSSEEEETVSIPDTPRTTNSEAVQSFNTCIKWAKERDLAIEHILLLKDMRNQALEACIKKTHQSSILSFLK